MHNQCNREVMRGDILRTHTHTCMYAIYDRGHWLTLCFRGHLLPLVFIDIPANSILYNSHLIIAGIFKLMLQINNMMITY